MDDYLFRQYVNECRVVQEETKYVEIFNYSDPFHNSCEEHPLTPDEFENFLFQRGAFAPPDLRPGTTLLSGLRLIVQTDAKDKDTFMPKVLSLPKDAYEQMVRVLRLPFRGIETTSVVGPFFWTSYDHDDADPHLHILHRKSDVRKKGRTRGWEMMLSHRFATGVTSGFVKGTPSSDIVAALKHVRACAAQVGHPLLLPTIILAHDLSPANDQKQRDARDWLRHLEQAVSMRDEVECHSNVLWKRPQAYMALTLEMEKAMAMFKDMHDAVTRQDSGETEEGGEAAVAGEKQRRELDRLHRSMLARMDFYKVKLTGLENYIHTTLQRLKVQREAREARLNLEIAGEQRRIAHASKRDSTAMKTISLLGTLFLPGTFLASVFSMTAPSLSTNRHHADQEAKTAADPVISDKLWVYFLLAIPITAAIVGIWIWYDKHKEAQYARDDEDLEKDIIKMEHDVMLNIRKKTISTRHTWNSISPPNR
ncbi:hypothetical protein LLEC1_01514 [Akanthomyces lecanii]|uniref:Uncharacterized protein n=1 Tax=Cordyceps confragosa TaxID=2714763 RepID=A0A179I812_CORDF|nr:hypothetical protein LLEC1_01514 [Akanthomyces lecanii]